MAGFDVYSYGIIAPSTLLVLKNPYPAADGYAEYDEKYHMTGGEAANSSIVLSRLGVKIRLDGNWLGRNETSERTIRLLKSAGIDTRRITLKPSYQNVEEFVVTDGKTRTIFATYTRLLFTGRQWNDASTDDIRSSKLVCLDPFLHEASRKAAETCLAFNKPYVTVDVKYDDPVSMNSSCVIVSGEFRNREYAAVSKEDLLGHYVNRSKGLVIFTSGESDILYGRTGQRSSNYKPPAITPLDTTGGGDSFRSGIIFGMLQGWDDAECVRFAAKLAVYICMTFPGVLKAPTLRKLDDSKDGIPQQ